MEKQIFQFTNYDVPVEIAGHQFTMNCSTDTGDYLKDVAANLRKLSEQVSNGQKGNRDIQDYVYEVIDHLLGEGAATLLLADRKNKTSDVMDLCMFLTNVAAKFRDERQLKLMNRSQRRSASKKQWNGKK